MGQPANVDFHDFWIFGHTYLWNIPEKQYTYEVFEAFEIHLFASKSNIMKHRKMKDTCHTFCGDLPGDKTDCKTDA